MRHLFNFLLLCLPLVAAGEASLPICSGTAQDRWHMCWGSKALPGGHTYVGEFRLGKPDGRGTYAWSNGEKFVGEFRDGKIHGEGTYTFPDASLYVGDFRDGAANGRGTFVWPSGERYVGEWRNDKRDGRGIQYSANGVMLQSGTWRDGQLLSLHAIDSERFPFDGWQPTQPRPTMQAQGTPPPNKPQANFRPERRVALIVGNAAYKISPLDNPVNDAIDVDTNLKRAGFQTMLLRNATLAQMREATRRFADQLPTADVALIYFAGHGIEARGRNYMVPVNADLKFEHELLDQAFDASQWLEMLEGIRSANADRVNIVILDACRNNSLIGSRSLSRGLSRLDAPSGTFLAYSTAPGKVAADGPRGQRNSPFTKHLLQAMQQPNLPIEEVFKEVRRNVSRETSGAQVPWESTSLTGFFSFRPVP